MSRTRLIHPLALCATLLAVGCTDTVTREVLVDGNGGSSSDAGGAFGDAPDPSLTDANPFGERPAPGGAGPDPIADAPLPLTDPEAVVGEPGTGVDCAMTLPCRWMSADSGFAITVVSGDDTGSQDGLSVGFLVDANHDTEVAYGAGAEVLGAGGQRYQAIARTLGEGNGIAPTGLLAGETLEGSIDYSKPAGTTSLAQWRVGLLDNGLARSATFENVPLGPAESLDADCEFVLPCTWFAADGSAAVTLGSAGGLADERRLSVGFAVTTLENDSIVLAGASAVGDDGTAFSSRTLTLGTESGFETLTGNTVAALPSAATVDFRRTETEPRALSLLELELYRDAPVPRWNVVFRDVPLP